VCVCVCVSIKKNSQYSLVNFRYSNRMLFFERIPAPTSVPNGSHLLDQLPLLLCRGNLHYSLSPGSVFFARLTDRKSSECNYSVEVYTLPPRTDVCLGLVLFCAGVTNFSAMPEAEATKCPLPEFFSGGRGPESKMR